MMRIKKILAWTRAYSPFRFGPPHYLVGARLDCDGPVHVGHGFHVVQLMGPDGLTRIAEVTTGGVVGSTLEEVTASVEACQDVEFMRQQIEDAKRELKASRLNIVDPEQWWNATGQATW